MSASIITSTLSAIIPKLSIITPTLSAITLKLSIITSTLRGLSAESNFTFLRPWWLFSLIPLLIFACNLFNQRLKKSNWQSICDPKLLPHLLINHHRKRYILPLSLFFLSGVAMVLGLAGPAWQKIDVPTYQQIQPRVLLLDMSEDMLVTDLSPDRLTRAKFKLHDLLQQKGAGQFALIAYTGEPFIVSPLTDDAKTIDNLLPALTVNVMPVSGNNLGSALQEAQQLFKASGASSGDILVLSGKIPDKHAVSIAKKLRQNNIRTSILPILNDDNVHNFFTLFAEAGNGRVIDYTFDQQDINKWLELTHTNSTFKVNELKNVPLMRDEGRLFVFLAIILILPFFRRGYLARING